MGAYSGTTSPYGAFDMAGDVWQWNEALISGQYRGLRGGSFSNVATYLESSYRVNYSPAGERYDIGFRVASVPEPGTGVLALVGCGLMFWWHKRRK